MRCVWLIVLLAGCMGPAEEAVVQAGPDEAPSAPAADPDEPSAADAAPAPPAGPRAQESGTTWHTHTVHGRTSVNAAYWGWDTALAPGIRVLDLYVPRTATALLVEASWDDRIQDLDLEVHAPIAPGQSSIGCFGGGERVWCDDDGHIGVPDAPARILIEDLDGHLRDCERPARPDRGDCNVFSIGLRSKDANAMLDWRVDATVFEGGPPPAGFTAVAAR